MDKRIRLSRVGMAVLLLVASHQVLPLLPETVVSDLLFWVSFILAGFVAGVGTGRPISHGVYAGIYTMLGELVCASYQADADWRSDGEVLSFLAGMVVVPCVLTGSGGAIGSLVSRARDGAED